MTLLDRYFGAPITPHKWKIYDRDTRRKLSDDYGAETGDLYFDDWRVWSIIVKTDKAGSKYYRVSVYNPDRRFTSAE